jgi:hypothetical protein
MAVVKRRQLDQWLSCKVVEAPMFFFWHHRRVVAAGLRVTATFLTFLYFRFVTFTFSFSIFMFHKHPFGSQIGVLSALTTALDLLLTRSHSS